VFLVADQWTRTGPVPDGPAPDRPSRHGRLVAEAAAITVLVVAGVTVGAGLGWTWLGPTALHVPTELRVLITPLVVVGTFVHGLLHAVGVPVALSATITAVEGIGAVVAVGAILWMVLHPGDRDAVRLCGLALLVFVLLSPTLWPWYLTWGVTVLAATPAQRSRALAAVAGLAMLVVGAGGTPMLNGGSYWVTGPVLVAALAWYLWSGRARTTLRGPSYAA